MIEIRITGESFTQIQKEVFAFFKHEETISAQQLKEESFDPKTAATVRGFVADRMHKHTETKVAEIEEEKIQERKKKAKIKKEKIEEVKAKKENPEEKVLTPSKEEVNEALHDVVSTLNLSAARDILLEFGCERVSELKETQYLDFVQACKAAIKE